MSIESDLKKEGIEIIQELDTMTVNLLAKKISAKICAVFPEYSLDKDKIFAKLASLHMYKAKIPKGFAEANYYYKNTSIYFNENIKDDKLEDFAIHECIHYLQEIKDNKNTLLRMGLCDYSDIKIYGLGLNEAAVQLIASKANKNAKEYVKYFGISFETISPLCYPLECCLVNQMAYITGENSLFESTLNSNDNFKIKFSDLTSPKVFLAIQNAIDEILFAEEEIIKLNNRIANVDDRNKKIDGMLDKIEELKKEISLTFMRTQNLILSSYFDNAFNNISTIDEIESYRKKLYNFKDYIGVVEGYTFFNDYYVNKMEQLEEKYNAFENGEVVTALKLVSKKESKFKLLMKAIRKLIFGAEKEKQNDFVDF
ncbi:MAG: hypothetical protein HUJ68_13670 [Clostridia bacterium]|nr:hypothetical protein [Clostridia bacterium]